MRFIILISILFFPALIMAQSEMETRLDALESRLSALEAAIESSQCELHYKFHAHRLNRCDKGTFVRSVTDVGGGTVNLECGYYQLVCYPVQK